MPWRGRNNYTLHVKHNSLCWQCVTNTKTVNRLSADSPDISTWLGSSLCSLSKRLTQWVGGIFIGWYCINSCCRITEQGPWDWDWSRATWHLTRPVLHCDKTSATGENIQHQSFRCNKKTDLDKDVFEWQCQDVPSHRTFTSKERHLYVNLSDPQQEMIDRNRWIDQETKGDDSEDSPIVHHECLKTIQIWPHVRAATHQGDNIYRHNGKEV